MARIRAPLRPAPSWLAARTGGPRHERPVGARRAGRCTRCGAGLPPQPPRPAESRGPEDTSGEGRRSCAWARCVPYRAGRAAARRPARARPMRRRRCDGEPERSRAGRTATPAIRARVRGARPARLRRRTPPWRAPSAT
ncbi:unnamed protein product [Prorocentrum cordatum]|uniref:Uncharacterized protein n=1 Tax=Prorocentrum cordatum TaxID=2364126 RepID=A0ABN9YI79_9DINO|nr:unnamed protein product [Polarella glacialis]